MNLNKCTRHCRSLDHRNCGVVWGSLPLILHASIISSNSDTKHSSLPSLPEREKYSVSTTVNLHNADRLYVSNAVTTRGMWYGADVSNHAASTNVMICIYKSESVLSRTTKCYRHKTWRDCLTCLFSGAFIGIFVTKSASKHLGEGSWFEVVCTLRHLTICI